MAIIHHLAKLEYIAERVTILQAKFILRTYYMPDDALFPILIPRIQQNKGLLTWNTFQRNNDIWKSLPLFPSSSPTTTTATPIDDNNNFTTSTTTQDLKNAIEQYLITDHKKRCNRKNSKLLNQCRKYIGIDPILWLPMSSGEHIFCIYYRLGWITNHQQQSCPNCHQVTRLSTHHPITCHNVHTFLYVSTTITDPISFVLNCLPKSPPTSYNKRAYLKIIWPKLYYSIHQLRRTCKPEQYTTPSRPIHHFGQLLVKWIEPPTLPPT